MPQGASAFEAIFAISSANLALNASMDTGRGRVGGGALSELPQRGAATHKIDGLHGSACMRAEAHLHLGTLALVRARLVVFAVCFWLLLAVGTRGVRQAAKRRNVCVAYASALCCDLLGHVLTVCGPDARVRGLVCACVFSWYEILSMRGCVSVSPGLAPSQVPRLAILTCVRWVLRLPREGLG